nr:MAG TPA: replication protein [Crassvirales sp.]
MNQKYYMKIGDKLIEIANPKMNANKRRYINKASDNYDKAASKVIKTIFTLNTNRNKDSEEVYEGLKGQILLNKLGKIKRKSYHTVNDDFWIYIEDLNPYQIVLLIYISCHLEYNSNVYIANYEQIANDLHLSVSRIQHLFIELIAIPNQIIAKTNIAKVYLINHNILFRGSYDEFIDIYNELYDGEQANLDDKNRVIIV